MKHFPLIPQVVFILCMGQSALFASDKFPLLHTIEISDVSGRIDHLAFDPKVNRLFIAAVANNTLEIVDVNNARHIGTISGLNGPQSVLYITAFERIVISNGGDGSVRFFNGETFALFRTVDLGDDADNMRYDSIANRIYVGYGNGALAILDATDGRLTGTIKLPGNPESFALESKGGRIFVNVPSTEDVIVIDRENKTQIVAWHCEGMRDNFPLALDEDGHRLFIGFRSPAALVVLNSDSGREIDRKTCVSDVDDIFYDAEDKRIYLSGGGGNVEVFGHTGDDRYSHMYTIVTGLGARTSLLVPERKSLYVAVPRLLIRKAQIRVYGLR